MAPVVVDPRRVRAFESADAFERWLSKNHDREPEVWIKIHKKASGLATITPLEAIDVVLCWGWIDAIRKGFDETSFLQRYTPRGPKSLWSQINRDNVARLVAAGRMTSHGQRHVDVAKADGRWEAAYAPIRAATAENMPADLRAAIARDARAQETFDTLNKGNLFALAFRTNNMRTPAGRAKKIAALVEMLARGETIVPNGQVKAAATTKAAKTKAAAIRTKAAATKAKAAKTKTKAKAAKTKTKAKAAKTKAAAAKAAATKAAKTKTKAAATKTAAPKPRSAK